MDPNTIADNSLLLASNDYFSYSDRDLYLVPNITFAFVEKYIKSNTKSSGESHINPGYKQGIYVLH
jgi:hypothetical protein